MSLPSAGDVMRFTWHVVNLNNCVVLLCFLPSMIEVKFGAASSVRNCDDALLTYTFDTICHVDVDELGRISV